ncbi:hypothetical protein D9756_006973 [Leucocoprinus leucothites]|uniref:Uncharacterized protein n=1 Tax=Leucocoprinus leucothites TaxID=201217 RepID=A0A8H5FYM5_9AGAR|nr:hypothetical protein D9756_006973 [Leucoagaricus leucothites]
MPLQKSQTRRSKAQRVAQSRAVAAAKAKREEAKLRKGNSAASSKQKVAENEVMITVEVPLLASGEVEGSVESERVGASKSLPGVGKNGKAKAKAKARK